MTIEIPAERFLVVDEKGQSVAEGSVVLYAGMGQPDAQTEKLTGHKAIRIEL